MAIFHLSAKVVSRGSGQSAIAKAAYNARAKLQDERTGQTKDYSRMNGLTFSGVFAPTNAPAWASDRQQLWNEVERKEDASKRAADAQLARQIIVALPHELTGQQREWLVKDYVREQFTRKGMIADVNIHEPSEAGDERNHHAHILLTMRSIGPEGFGPKVREWNSRQQVEKWREEWERITNRHLERHGFDDRIDRRTLEAQGIEREPTTHRGPHVDAIARKGTEPENVKEDSGQKVELAQLKAELAEVQERVAAERELFIKLNEVAATSPGVAVAETLAEAAATVKDKLKDTVRDVIAPEPAAKDPAKKEPDREPTDWKRMLVDRDYRRQKQEERERRQQDTERQQGREDTGGRSRDRS